MWATVLLIVAFIPEAASAWLHSVRWGAVNAGVVLLVAALILRFYTVQVRPDGVLLYSLWWLPWENVAAVRYARLCGLPHLYVQRKKGWVPGRIPLYFVGDGDLLTALKASAPADNPIRAISAPAPDMSRARSSS